MKNEECLICKAPLEYLEKDELKECAAGCFIVSCKGDNYVEGSHE